jgi:hypothetical protein
MHTVKLFKKILALLLEVELVLVVLDRVEW